MGFVQTLVDTFLMKLTHARTGHASQCRDLRSPVYPQRPGNRSGPMSTRCCEAALISLASLWVEKRLMFRCQNDGRSRVLWHANSGTVDARHRSVRHLSNAKLASGAGPGVGLNWFSVSMNRPTSAILDDSSSPDTRFVPA